jgi:hypothetical protein
MDMIGRPIDGKRDPAQRTNDPAKIWMQARL